MLFLIIIYSCLMIIFEIIYWIPRYQSHRKNNRDQELFPTVIMTFDDFCKIFYVNPKRWTLDMGYSYPTYLIERENPYLYFISKPCLLGYDPGESNDIIYHVVMSNYRDFRKFAKWLKKYSKNKNTITRYENEIRTQHNLEKMLNIVKKDISDLQEKANNDISQAKENLKKIYNP